MTYLEWLSERFRNGQGFAEENARRRRERLAANNGQEPPRVSLPHYLAALWNGQGTPPGQNQPVRQGSQPKSSGQAPADQNGLRNYFTEPPPPPAPKPPALPEGVETIRYARRVPPLSKPVEDQLRKEAGARGILTLDVSSTLRKGNKRSNHYRGLAADIYEVNNQPVVKYPNDPQIRADVNALIQHANKARSHEVFGPGAQTFKDGKNYRSLDPVRQRKLETQHENHIHIAVGHNPVSQSQQSGGAPRARKGTRRPK